MFKKFVPSTEKQQAKQDLISLQWKFGTDMYERIENFEELRKIAEKGTSKDYNYFFLTFI